MNRLRGLMLAAVASLMTGCNTAKAEPIESADPTTIATEAAETVVYEGKSYDTRDISEDTLKWLDWYNGLSEEVQRSISAVPSEFIDSHTLDGEVIKAQETNVATGEEPTAAVDLLTSAPEIALTDLLSSKMQDFTLNSGNYSWTWREWRGEQSVIACGMSPLDDTASITELSIPAYNGLKEVMYNVGCVIPPDKILVRSWNKSDIGNMEAIAVSEKTYDNTMIELEKERVYELVATWSKEKLDERGFSGEASYAFHTN